MCLLSHWIQSSMHTGVFRPNDRDAIIKGLTLKRKTWQFENRFKHRLDDYDLLQLAQHSILAYPSHIPFYSNELPYHQKWHIFFGWIEKNDKQIHRFSAQPWPLQSQFLTSWTLSSPWTPSTPSPALTLLLQNKWVCLVGGHPVCTIFQYQWTKQGEYLHIIMDLTHFFSRFLHSFLLVWYHPWLLKKHGQKEDNDIGIDSGIETSGVIINDEYII